ncbi:type II toxin-antitoxin system Phd/YefM family antitoxin [Gloeocapsa sp. PCC 73106]|uniref:type II toxin-antitoxin system Phd/YefM family antitoxin n=1 Tax=Gloeocapsa sp. PCC 73106 TaxID=102232 RepID=UPI0002AC10C4|nr:type II toxin-antitoxin system prevent-host-death family antitoxin [Gloeocapsa sp. PCC 73106]ELR97671.1 prevent-host-death family protein [Gloeocapsa sp. PCC 73106]
MTITNIHEAKSTLSKLIEAAMAGEEVIISKAGKPVAKIVVYNLTNMVKYLVLPSLLFLLYSLFIVSKNLFYVSKLLFKNLINLLKSYFINSPKDSAINNFYNLISKEFKILDDNKNLDEMTTDDIYNFRIKKIENSLEKNTMFFDYFTKELPGYTLLVITIEHGQQVGKPLGYHNDPLIGRQRALARSWSREHPNYVKI